ncbi:hypothetical protein M378DRAFT_557535 [Amanita muscaria Koide BX008]|uniref:Uncharacterized protein n=1 Tax=Amanita muscaria (strain Koide BX008) TaxID=946122 RepID=A0A0C2TE15_AMAMK|nr:hypothetical protein M378DRAFT_557535 [Amanita muscaria Koide BX008]
MDSLGGLDQRELKETNVYGYSHSWTKLEEVNGQTHLPRAIQEVFGLALEADDSPSECILFLEPISQACLTISMPQGCLYFVDNKSVTAKFLYHVFNRTDRMARPHPHAFTPRRANLELAILKRSKAGLHTCYILIQKMMATMTNTWSWTASVEFSFYQIHRPTS